MALRRNLVAYAFKPLEVLALLVLCDETFDCGAVQGRVELGRWAGMLGLRADKFRQLWGGLLQSGVVDFNAGQGTYELRPDPSCWAQAVVRLRVRTDGRFLDRQDLAVGQHELPLRAERPVSEAMSSVSRDLAVGALHDHEALAGGQGGGKIRRDRADAAAEKSAGSHDHDPDHDQKHDSRIMSHGTMTHEPAALGDTRPALTRLYDVGTASPMTGNEIIDAVEKSANRRLDEKTRLAWTRRLGENATLVWQAAAEARQRHELDNPIGWMNRMYLREQGILR